MLTLTIENGHLYLGNMYFSRVDAGNGKSRLPTGTFPVSIHTKKKTGKGDMVHVEGIGYFGGDSQCDIIVGGVRSKSRLLPDPMCAFRLVRSVERHLDQGPITLEVK